MSPSVWQILIVVGIIVLLFGARRLPDLGKSMGQAIKGFKEGVSEDEIDVTDSSANQERLENDSQAQSQSQTEKEKETT